MAEKKQTQTENVEREYVIPLRVEWNKVPRYKRANKAIKAIKEFLARHMKVYDRDLNKIKVDKYLNEEVWHRGIKRPPARVKVKVVKDGEVFRVSLADMPDKLKFKKIREERAEQKASEKTAKKSPEAEKPAQETKKEESDKDAEKEKKASVVESEQKIEKEFARKAKHETKQSKEPKHQQRKALKK